MTRSTGSPRAVSIRTGCRRADLAADIEPIDIREGEVKNYGVEGLTTLQSQTGCPVGGNSHLEARPVEIGLHHLGEAWIVFNEQDAIGHRSILAAVPPLPVGP